MLPPAPPSPPSGPPRGTYFSRRKLTAPSPPLPAWTSIRASSKNFMPAFPQTKKPCLLGQGFCSGHPSLFRQHAHDTVVGRAALTEHHGARKLRIERVVAPHADVRARVHPRSALTHEDAARGDHLAAVAFHAQALGFRITAVAGTAACLLVSHCAIPRC